MPMQKQIIMKCPHCGQAVVFDLTPECVEPEAAELDIALAASTLGIELGALKGGEEIGD